MPEEWKTRVDVPIFKGKGDVMSCGAYTGVKLLKHAMKIVKTVSEKKIRKSTNLSKHKQDAIWFYASTRDNRCSVYSSQNARGISR